MEDVRHEAGIEKEWLESSTLWQKVLRRTSHYRLEVSQGHTEVIPLVNILVLSIMIAPLRGRGPLRNLSQEVLNFKNHIIYLGKQNSLIKEVKESQGKGKQLGRMRSRGPCGSEGTQISKRGRTGLTLGPDGPWVEDNVMSTVDGAATSHSRIETDSIGKVAQSHV